MPPAVSVVRSCLRPKETLSRPLWSVLETESGPGLHLVSITGSPGHPSDPNRAGKDPESVGWWLAEALKQANAIVRKRLWKLCSDWHGISSRGASISLGSFLLSAAGIFKKLGPRAR
ncbi:hypothetical protein AOLI_G00162700 [Acnodon oligacanthus]